MPLTLRPVFKKMANPDTGKLKVWTPVLFSLVLIVGMTVGFNLRDSLRNKRDIKTVIQRNDRLEQLISLINERYVDSVDPNVIYKDAITGVLSHLDPHTIYIPADELQSVNEDLGGSFFGIGVEFAIIKDTIQVTSIIEGGPAERAGVLKGDQIIKVGDSTVAGAGITSDRIIKMLKGKQHSQVFVTVQQPYTPAQRHLTIKRDAVPLYSVEASIMLDSITGFIKINRFSATTYEEFTKAFSALSKQGMKQLVLDLRQNPGGYLDAATNIADDFISGDKLLVYTQGRRSSKTEYKAGNRNQFENGRLAILVDESSASASEVLAGAVQDWDRGIIIGRRTFGKGLVQEQFEMEDGSALRLTIAKYYTPSGRSIQRSYADGKSAYAEDISKRLESGELTGDDSLTIVDTTHYYTASKRVVYGSGGINPDIYVPYDTSMVHTANLLFNDDTRNIVWNYYLKNKKALEQFKSIQDYAIHFKADDLAKFYISDLDPDFQKSAKQLVKTPANNTYLQQLLKAQLARVLFRNNGYYSINAQYDNVIRTAMQAINGKAYAKAFTIPVIRKSRT
jgi:carboxyl-terminal processing protease